MEIQTKLFGTIEIDEDKIITLESGIIGFPSLNQFLLLYDQDKKGKATIYWLQSIDEPLFSLPVMDPLIVCETYNPMFEEELLKPIGEPLPQDMLVFTTLTVPSDSKNITINLKAPIVINTAAKKGCQLIIDNDDYLVRYPIYEILSAKQERAGE